MFESRVLFSCEPGYWTPAEQLEVTCQNDSTYSSATPLCLPKDCGPAPAAGENQLVDGSDKTTYESVVTYTCEHGYYPREPFVIVCTSEGEKENKKFWWG